MLEKIINTHCGHFPSWSPYGSWRQRSCMKQGTHLTGRDAWMALRGWRAGGKCLGLFLHWIMLFRLEKQTQHPPCQFHSLLDEERGHEESGEMFCWQQQTMIKHICFMSPPKVHLSTWVLSLGLPALGQPVSHIQNQVTVLVLKVDAGCCAAEKQGLSRLSAFDVSIHHPRLGLRLLAMYASVSCHPHLVCSLLMKSQSLFLPCLTTPNFYFIFSLHAPSDSMNFPVWSLL